MGSDGTTYDVNAFSGGAMSFATGATTDATNNVDELEGTASYAGPAGGMYVRKSLTSDGDVDAATHGNFTAHANLTAKFGGDAVAADDQFSISGMVKNFMDGTTSLDGWSVDLKRANFVDRVEATGATDPSTPNHRGTFSGATTGDGTWSGQFFGPTTTDDNATADVDEGADAYPSGVAGEFNAHFTNGHVSGAFGAVKQD